jgi:hypothetical protein
MRGFNNLKVGRRGPFFKLNKQAVPSTGSPGPVVPVMI